jgi:pimeloyl-ACP methyl ester carboxylesterase
MEPFYFGSSNRRLFGIYHPPTAVDRGAGVVLCYPMGQEYLRVHRAFLRLATRLAEAGFHAFRFDYCGCGDSSHDSEYGEVERWQEDIGTALEELREGSGAGHFTLLGVRLGGTLAAVAAAGLDDVDALVLWDPVVDGGGYLADLRREHQKFYRGSFAKAQPSADEEVLGFPLSVTLAEGLGKLNLLALESQPARRALLLSTQDEEALFPLAEHFADRGVATDQRYIATPPVWVKTKDEQGKVDSSTVAPRDVLSACIEWMSESLPDA